MINKPLVTIKNAWLADIYRCGKSRVAGAFSAIRNLFPTISDGVGRLRTGFSDYTTVAEVTGMQDAIIVPIQRPSQEDIHIQFADDSGQKVYVNPWWQVATKKTTNLQINETKTITVSTGTGSTGNHTLTFTNADTLALSTSDDYYNGWIIFNSTRNGYALVTDYDYTAGGSGTAVLTMMEFVNIDDATDYYNWDVAHAYTLYRSFHSSLAFSPAYNNSVTNPPTARADDSVIRFSGGQGSTAGNVGIIYFPYFKRIFFPADATYKYTYEGSYIGKRELSPISSVLLFCDGGAKISCADSSGSSLLLGKTYWLAFAPIYDGYQIGELTKLEDIDNDYTVTGAYWTKNYLQTTAGATGQLTFAPKIRPQLWSKRITGLAVYLATDDGQQTVRQNQYKYVGYLDFLTDEGYMSTATFNATYNYWEFSSTFLIDKDTNIGNTYVTDSGIVESPLDTMYAYSIEEKIGGKHYLADVYVTSETAADKQRLFTNPVGQNAEINAGLVQPDLFSNEEGVYRFDAEQTIGTKITALKSIGMGEVLLFRDRGILWGSDITNTVNMTEFSWTIISPYAGSCAVNGVVDGNEGFLYFAGYDDIYRFRGNNLEVLIERPDKNDWLYTYQNTIDSDQKDSVCTFYLPEINCVYFLFANNGETYTNMQYVYFPAQRQWREVYLGEAAPNRIPLVSFKRANKIQGGNTICMTQGDTSAFRRMTYSGTSFVYTDNTVTIKPYFSTHYFIPSGSESDDFVMTKAVINKTLTGTVTAGTLDCYLYVDTTGTEFADQSKTDTHLELYPPLGANMGQQIAIVYNSDNTCEYITSGAFFVIDSIEIYGKVIPRVRANE